MVESAAIRGSDDDDVSPPPPSAIGAALTFSAPAAVVGSMHDDMVSCASVVSQTVLVSHVLSVCVLALFGAEMGESFNMLCT